VCQSAISFSLNSEYNLAWHKFNYTRLLGLNCTWYEKLVPFLNARLGKFKTYVNYFSEILFLLNLVPHQIISYPILCVVCYYSKDLSVPSIHKLNYLSTCQFLIVKSANYYIKMRKIWTFLRGKRFRLCSQPYVIVTTSIS